MNKGAKNLIPVSEIAKTDPERAYQMRRLGGINSKKKQAEKKKIQDALRAVLSEPISKGSDVTRLDAIAYKSIERLYKNPKMLDLKILAEIMGEIKQTITTEGLSLVINTDEKSKSEIEKLLNEAK